MKIKTLLTGTLMVSLVTLGLTACGGGGDDGGSANNTTWDELVWDDGTNDRTRKWAD